MKPTALCFLVLLTLTMILPYPAPAEHEPWWNDAWTCRQELALPIDTTVDLARNQPVDTTIMFKNPCWALDPLNSSVRVIMQTQDAYLELESQIYNLNHTDPSHISSCDLVFLVPENATGDEQYYIYYHDSETPATRYPDHVSIEDSSYAYEPIPGYPLQSHFYKISQDGIITYAVSQEGEFLWYSTTQYITKLRDGATEMTPKNGEAAASFDFTYYYGEEMADYNSTSQHLISKEILTDGNLLASCRVTSGSTGGDLETVAEYKYYYCPTPYKRIHAHVTHTVLRDCKVSPTTNTDGTYATLQCGRVRSASITDLNFGMLYPYLHLSSARNTTDEYPVDLNPAYSQDEPVSWLIDTSDDVRLGTTPWVDFDGGATGAAHALIFASNSIVKAGTGEQDGIQLKLYESAYPRLPGLQNDVEAFECTRNTYHPKGGPSDTVIPKGFSASFDAEFFSTPQGGYPLVQREATFFRSLARIQPTTSGSLQPQENETNHYTLIVTVRHAPSFPLGADLSILTGHDFPFITVELYQQNHIISSGTATRLPVKPFSGTNRDSFLGRLVAATSFFDLRNISVFKKFQFQSLDPGAYLIKVFKENPFFRNDRQYIGYTTVDIKHNDTATVVCTRQGSLHISLLDQQGKSVQGAIIQLKDNNTIVSENSTDQQGDAILNAPCGVGKKYMMNVLYNGFLVDNESIPFRTIRTMIPLKQILQVDRYSWMITVVDTWELPPTFDVAPRLTSTAMSEPLALQAEQQAPGRYLFSDIPPATYQLQMQYKSFKIEQSIIIPAQPESFVFPATFPVTFHVLGSRGLPLADTILMINRSGNTVHLNQNSSSATVSLPPGDYTISVISHGEIINKRPLSVVGERTLDLVTTKDPMYPILIVIGIIVLSAAFAVYCLIKKDLVLLCTLLSLSLVVFSSVLPWWSLTGIQSDITTSSVFYLAPPNLVTITRSASVISGELSYVPDLFTTVVSGIFLITALGGLLCLVSLVFRRKHRRKIHLLLTLGAVLLFGMGAAIFSYSMAAFSQVGVGSFLGHGTVDVSIPGRDTPVPIPCHWGPAEGFIVFLIAIIVLLAGFLFEIRKKKKN